MQTPSKKQRFCSIKIVDGKQLLFMPDGTQIPGQVMTRVTQHYIDNKFGDAIVKFRVNIK